jgi:GMP synthase (glutamine-hydrolysing)
MSRRVILLHVVGAPSSSAMIERFGTFTDWFQACLAQHDGLEVRVFDGHTGQMPSLADVHGVVITGSPSSLTAPEPWMEAALALVRLAHAEEMPLLGVCFGHQLIGQALGGRVIRNPAGWELGSLEIGLTDAGQADPLFAGLPARFRVNLSHEDMVTEESLVELPGVRVLASSARARVQAVAAGPYVRGVQFHPEFSGAVTAAYIDTRREALVEQARQRQAPEDGPERLLAEVQDCPEGEAVLHNFVTHFVRPSRRA